MKLRQAPNAVWRQALGVLVVAVPDGEPTVIKGSAPEVWRELANWCTETEIIERLARRFSVGHSTVRADLVPLIHELVARGLVVTDTPGADREPV